MEVIVVGGSAAGLKAACRISRLQPDANVKVLVRDRFFGYSACGMPYYLSGDIDRYTDLISTANGTIKDEVFFKNVKGVEVITRHEVTGIDRRSRKIQCRDLENDELKIFPYDRLVLATGSIPMLPAIPGIHQPGIVHFTKLESAMELRRELETGKITRVAIIGGGFIGIELCEAFRAMWGVDVELIELQPHVLPTLLDPELSMLVESELFRQGITVRLGCRCKEIVTENDRLCLFDSAGDMISVDKIVVTTGLKPNTTLAKKSGVEIGVSGGIKVNDRLQTSDPDIYAAGDCVELTNRVDGKQGTWAYGSLANQMGRIVGDNICNGDSKFGQVVGTTVLKMFGLTIGAAGITSAQCRDNGYETGSSWATFYDRMFYYPEVGHIHIKMIFDKQTNTILGIQVVSDGQALHVIDKAAQIVKEGWTVDGLASLEHAYSPPYSQPFDPLQTMGYIADNSKYSGVRLVSPLEYEKLDAKTVILDVRTPDETVQVPLKNDKVRYLAIPVENLRQKIHEVPKNLSIVVACQMGSRAWDAALMLRRAGWDDVGILAGGTMFLPAFFRKSHVGESTG